MISFNTWKGYLVAALVCFTFLVSTFCFAEETNKDPLERYNRAMFRFNEHADMFVFKPVATLYNKIVPKPLNKGIHNIFNNLATLPTIANDILQLHFYQMTNDIWRFAINTTLGIGGLFDVAKLLGLEPYVNDFGLTLAHYGWRHSTYFVLPFFGPSTFRDTIEIPVDYYAFSVYPYITDRPWRYTVVSLYIIDTRAQLLKFQSLFDEVAYDKYTFTRNAYLQRQAYRIERNQARQFLQRPRNIEVEEVSIPVSDADAKLKTQPDPTKFAANKPNKTTQLVANKSIKTPKSEANKSQEQEPKQKRNSQLAQAEEMTKTQPKSPPFTTKRIRVR